MKFGRWGRWPTAYYDSVKVLHLIFDREQGMYQSNPSNIYEV